MNSPIATFPYPRLYLVLGPESSGTRLATRILIAAGCVGSHDHHQPFDTLPFPDDAHSVVWRRSVPHFPHHEWLNLTSLLSRRGDREVLIVVTTRGVQVTAKSQVRVGHVPSISAAIDNIERAYVEIFTQLARNDLSPVILSYEELIAYPIQTQSSLLTLLDLPIVHTPIYDGNAKYLAVSTTSTSTPYTHL